MAVNTYDIHYLAGLLEGEGCFHLRKNRQYMQPVIQLMMCDEEPIAKVSKIVKEKYIKNKNRTVTGKSIYRLIMYGMLAIGWMQTLYPLMSPRRQEKIRSCLAAFKQQTGKARTKQYFARRELGGVPSLIT